MGLGISIYPLQSSYEANKRYIQTAAELGYTRVFTSFLEADPDTTKAHAQLEQYRQLLTYANSLGMHVFLDMNPEVMKILAIDPADTQFFTALGASGLRLDGAFNGFYEAYLTYNDSDLIVEVNGSFDSGYINSILDLGGKRANLWTCHNFYPEADTGLSVACFQACHQRHQQLGLRTAAFVTSQERTATQGPWDTNDGLCTLEQHRHLPIEIQAQQLFQYGIDDVIIGDAFASDAELAKLAAIAPTIVTLAATLDSEWEAVTTLTCQNRWDYSDVIIRDVMSRKIFAKKAIPAQTTSTRSVPVGTILVNNDDYGRYKGEILIALQPLTIDHRRNIIGHVEADYLSFLNGLTGGKRFVITHAGGVDDGLAQ